MHLLTAYLPAEVFRRELVSKTVLAAFLASKGLRVIFGHRWYVTYSALSNARKGDLFFTSHPIAKHDLALIGPLLDRGVCFIGNEDEAVFDEPNYSDQILQRQHSDDFSNFKFWTPWGNRDFEVISNISPKHVGILNKGNYRTALWGDFGREFYFNESNEIASEYQEYLLFATSFAPTIAEHRETIKRFHKNNQAFSIDRLDKDAEVVNNVVALERTKIAISTLLRNTSLKIVIRPYNSKSDFMTRSLLKSIPRELKDRVFVDNRPQITPLILASKGVVHQGSTVGIESLALGKITVDLNEFYFDSKSLDSMKLSSLRSIRPLSEDELVRVFHGDSIRPKIDVDDLVTVPKGIDFYNDLWESIKQLGPEFNNQACDKKEWISVKRSLLYRLFTFVRQGKVYRYDLEKRPHISMKSVLRDFVKASELFGIPQGKIQFDRIERGTYLTEHLK